MPAIIIITRPFRRTAALPPENDMRRSSVVVHGVLRKFRIEKAPDRPNLEANGNAQ